ncbi:MAG TPA: LacI family DNA-binding transcriptional regulator [Hymenobacter sp.]
MAELACELGVSMTTVSRSLSDQPSIGAATKHRVLGFSLQRGEKLR